MPVAGDIYEISGRSVKYPSDNPRDNALIEAAFPPPKKATDPKKQDPKKKLSNFDFESYEFKPEDIPYLRVSHDDTGQMKIEFSNPKEPKKSFTTKQDHTGSFGGSENSGDKPFKAKMSSGHERSYTAEGNGSQVDGHSDHKTESTKNENVGGDVGSATGKTRIEGTKEQKTGGTGGGTFMNDAKGDKIQSINGSYTLDHKGNWGAHHTGWYVSTIDGNYKTHVTKGEYNVIVEKGNMDTKVGKLYKLKADNTIYIESLTYIQLKVGDSVILIKPNGISISTQGSDGIQLITGKTGNILIDSENGNVGLAAEKGPIFVKASTGVTIKSKTGGTKIEAGAVIPPLPWDGTLGG
jgi:hypothetical protein